MSRLNTNLNELSKDPATQLAQLNLMGNDIINWSNNTNSQLTLDYTEPVQKTNETTKSTDYSPFTNFTFNFTPNNPLCTVTIHLLLQGEGTLGIFLNGTLAKSIYFLSSSPTQNTYSLPFNLSTNAQKISLQWKSASTSTTCTKINTSSQPGLNSLTIKSDNS